MAGEQLGSGEAALSYLRIAPNYRLPFGHRHGEQEEIYVLVGGSARLKLGKEVVELEPWDAVRIPRDTMRNLEAGSDGAELVLFGAPKAAPVTPRCCRTGGLRRPSENVQSPPVMTGTSLRELYGRMVLIRRLEETSSSCSRWGSSSGRPTRTSARRRTRSVSSTISIPPATSPSRTTAVTATTSLSRTTSTASSARSWAG